MAIDWLTGNFYFVDRVTDKIFVCDRGGDTCVTVLQQDLLNPKGIALDPLMGWVHTFSESHHASLIYHRVSLKDKKWHFTADNKRFIRRSIRGLQQRDLNDFLSFSWAIFSVCNLVNNWWCYIYLLLSRHSFIFTDFAAHPTEEHASTGLSLQDFCLWRSTKKRSTSGRKHIPTLLSVETVTFRACGWQSQWSQCWRIYYSCVTVQNKHTLHGPAVPAGEPIISNSFCNPASPGNSKTPLFVTSQSEVFVVYPFCFWLFGSRNNRLRSR